MKLSYLIFVLALLFSSSLLGQKVLTTNSGQRILLVDDGSWRILGASENVDQNNSESGTSLESFKSPKHGKHPINLDQREKIQSLLTNFLSDEAQLLVNMEMDKRKLDQLKLKKKTLNKDKTELEAVKNQIYTTREDIKKANKIYENTSDLIALANNLLDGKVKNAEKSLAALENRNGSKNITSGMGGSKSDIDEIAEQKEVKVIEEKKYPTMFSLDNRRGYENESDCQIIFDGYDKDIGKKRKEVKTQPFFSYSQEKMKPYFKTEDYLTCDASISKVGKKYYLTLNLRIKSKDAARTYGMLRSNENIKIELINGNSVYGRLINNDNGEIESYTGNTLYQGIIELEKGDIKELKNNYLDNLGIIWSSGYEQYDIYNVDFLVNQIECLNN